MRCKGSLHSQNGQEEQLQQPKHVSGKLKFKSLYDYELYQLIRKNGFKDKTGIMLSEIYILFTLVDGGLPYDDLKHLFVYHCITASNDAAILVNSCLHAGADLYIEGVCLCCSCKGNQTWTRSTVTVAASIFHLVRNSTSLTCN